MPKASPAEIILVRVTDTGMPQFRKIGGVQHPMSLVYLASYLDQQGFSAEIIDLEIEPFAVLEKRLQDSPPLLVGISVMTPNMPAAAAICRLCVTLGIRTVLGGPHPSALPEQTLAETGASFVISGEGEKPLTALVAALKAGSDTGEIAGLTFRDCCGVRVNPVGELLNLDELPMPNRRFLRLESYTGNTTPGVLRHSAVIQTTRGCPYGCTFCASGVINRRTVRFRSMESVFAEIDDINSLGFDHLTVEDDTFTLKPERVHALCNYLRQHHPHLTWDCDSRVDAVSDELLQAMKNSGCLKIAFGVESGSSRILQSIDKGITVEQVRRAFNLAEKHGIATGAFYMIGFPDETAEDIRATEQLMRETGPDYLGLYTVVPYPGTVIWEEMKRSGLISGYDWQEYTIFSATPQWRTRHFTASELAGIRNRLFRAYYFSHRYILKRLRKLQNPEELAYLCKCAVVAFKVFFLRR